CHNLEEVLAAERNRPEAPGEDFFSLLFAAADALEDAGTRLRADQPLEGASLAVLLPRLATATPLAPPKPALTLVVPAPPPPPRPRRGALAAPPRRGAGRRRRPAAAPGEGPRPVDRHPGRRQPAARPGGRRPGPGRPPGPHAPLRRGVPGAGPHGPRPGRRGRQ